MESIEIIYDHYKETFNLSKDAQARRNKNFVILCVLEALSFLILIKPEKAFEIIANGIKSELDLTLSLGNSIIQTLIWILIVYVSIRYVQDMMYIERQYGYMDKLEKQISESIEYHNLFSREGDYYKESFPMVLNFIDLFYKMLMPILFVIINSVHIYVEYTFEELRQALAKVPDAYYDFVDGYYRDFRGDIENQKKLLEYLANNPEAMSDDVIEYIDDVLLA